MRDAEEELHLRQVFDEVCRIVDAGGNDVAFAAIETSMYKRRRTAMPSLPNNSRDAEAAITESQLVSPFYRRSVDTGDGDTALIFASDGQLDLLYVRVLWCTSTPLFGWCLRYFISYLRSSSTTSITRYNKLNTTCEVHHLAFHTCLSFSSPAV